MKCRMLFVFLFAFNVGIAQYTSKSITEITSDELARVQLLDVRTQAEYDAGHLTGAIQMDWFADDFDSQTRRLDKEKIIYVYCKLGGRSAKAQDRLKSLGFTHVVNLEGGYDAWSAAHK